MGQETSDSLKTNFKDVLAAERAVLVKSNQTNLANAYLHLEQAEEAAKEYLHDLAELRLDIEHLGDQTLLAKDADGSATRRLYEKARKLAGKLDWKS